MCERQDSIAALGAAAEQLSATCEARLRGLPVEAAEPVRAGLIDALIEREGGYVNNPADKGGATNFGITEAVARANGYAGPMRDCRARRRRRSTSGSTGCARASTRSPSAARARGRAVRHRRQHGPGGRRDLPAARADRAQPQRQGLSRPGPDGRSATRSLAALDGFLAARGKRRERCC
jgi:hypothetical protein